MNLPKTFKPNYVIIPAVTILVALIGGMLTGDGMAWYKETLIRPDLTPPDYAFPIAWNIIFGCTTISALIIWNKGTTARFLWWEFRKNLSDRGWWVMAFFVINAVLNVVWSLLFFKLGLIYPAFVEMFFLEATVLILVALTWKISRTASLLLLPYLLWVGFATYLTYRIVLLNV